MNHRILAGALALLLPATIASAATPEPVAVVADGRLVGTVRDGVDAFLGIPYAAPPVGPNRWRAPQPVAKWRGVRAADHYAADCAQHPFPGDAAPLGTQPAEDCLYLNVWRPRHAAPGAKLPVMVWLYGGGFVNGGSSAPVYSGTAFARDDVILVSPNYRLGRFGFFAHPALKAEGGGGNFGFMDQIAALRWVKRNIAAFGGDPDNVTLFGESAGGISVNALMTSPMAHGLFSKAIIESGAGRGLTDPSGIPTLAQATAAGTAFSAFLGPRVDAATLRRLPADRVIDGLDLTGMDVPTYSGPMIDGRTVVEAPLAAYRAGRAAKVPVLLGTNSMDGLPFGNDKDALFAAFGDRAEEARRLYDPQDDRPVPLVAVDLFADRYMNEPTRAVARTLSPRGNVWLYRFDYVATSMRGEWAGAPHASEIPYVFDTLEARYAPHVSAEDRRMAKLMHGYWIAFARTGKPDAAGLPSWPVYDGRGGELQYISSKGAGPSQDPLRARLDFQSRAYAETPGSADIGKGADPR